MNNNNEKREEITKIKDLVENIKQKGCFIVMHEGLDENVKEDKYSCPELQRLKSNELQGHHICSTYFLTNRDGKPMIKLFLSSPTGVILDEDDINITAGLSIDLHCSDACDNEIKTGNLDKKLKKSQSVESFELNNSIDKNDEFIYSNYDEKWHRNLISICKKNGNRTNKQIMEHLKDVFAKQYSDNNGIEKLEHNEFEVLPKDSDEKKILIKSTFINITDDPRSPIKRKYDLCEANILESFKNFLLVLTDEGFKVIDRDKLNQADEYVEIKDLCENIDDIHNRLSFPNVDNNQTKISLEAENKSRGDDLDDIL